MTTTAAATTTCSRCGSTDDPKPLPKKYACTTCGPRPLCYACDTSHSTWCGQTEASVGEFACCGPYTPPCCGDPQPLDANVRQGAVHVLRTVCDSCGAWLNLAQTHQAHGLHAPRRLPSVTAVAR